jgi:predicted permease
MSGFVAVLETALPVFLALGLGMLCRSKGFLTRDGVDALKKTVLNLTLPFVLLEAFATAEYTAAALLLPLLMFGVCCLALGLGYLAVKLFRVKGKLTKFLFSGFEAGMLGYALFVLLFPGRSVSDFALPDIGQTLFVFTLYKTLLSGKTDIKAIGKDMASTPILWAVAAGVLIGATGLYGKMEQWGVAGILTASSSFLSAPTGMIILLTVGYDLVIREIPWKKTAGLIALRLGIMAVCYAVAVALNRTVLNGVLFEGAMLLMLILPPPYVIPVFADEPEERVQISSALSALTLVTMILFAVCSVVIGMR